MLQAEEKNEDAAAVAEEAASALGASLDSEPGEPSPLVAVSASSPSPPPIGLDAFSSFGEVFALEVAENEKKMIDRSVFRRLDQDFARRPLSRRSI